MHVGERLLCAAWADIRQSSERRILAESVKRTELNILTARLTTILIALLAMHGALAVEVFDAGRPLTEVRSELIQAGWKPRQTYLRRGDGQLEHKTGSALPFYAAGFIEVELCSGTGSNPCIFNYVRKGQCRRVYTVGEQVSTAQVTSMEAECPPEAAR